MNRKTVHTKSRAESMNDAAIKIQCMIRIYFAKKKVERVAREAWSRVFEPKVKLYFWYNSVTGVSSWANPRGLQLFTKDDHDAAIQIERIVRGFICRRRARRKAREKYSKFFEAKQHKFYYMNNFTGETFWDPSLWLQKQELQLPPEDQALYDSLMKIKELEDMLRKKDEEIKAVKQKRFEELEVEVVQDKLRNIKAIQRGKHMDEWSIDELAAFFTELKMEQYCHFLYSQRVDGLLFINLAEGEWADMGITNRFHVRKLQLIMVQYRARYERKKKKIELGEDEYDEDEDEIGTEYDPDDLSDMIRQEGMSESESEEEDIKDDDDFDDEEDDYYEMTDEERIEAEFDKQHLSMELVAAGDDTNYPITGDIVRVRYTCFLLTLGGIYDTENLQLVTSTKSGLQRPWVEFVVGVGMTIKGFDRAIPKMSIGERSKIRLTPTYAYGKEGLPPHIPPNSKLLFDCTLLSFRPRPVWIKPMIQEPGLSQKPYIDDETEGPVRIGISDDTASMMTASVTSSAQAANKR